VILVWFRSGANRVSHHEDQRIEVASAIVQSPVDLSFPRNRVCAKVEGNGLYICPKALTFKEAASAIRIRPANLAKFVASGALKSVKIGKSRRVFAYELWLFFDKRIDGKDASIGKEAC
jgi:hypothetical protein